MKTSLKAFKQNTHIPHALIDAVLEQMGISFTEFKDNARDYRDARAGVSGFIYYDDTHQFAIENREAIVELLEESAEQMGEDVVEMVKGFGVFGGEMDKDEKKDLYRFLGGGEVEQGAVTNVMAWFALEELANAVENFAE